MTTKKRNTLNLFTLLNNINKKNTEYYSQLSEDQLKEFVPFVTMRWLTGVKDPKQILFINEIVNPLVFHLYNHKKLSFYLMTICGNGNPSERFEWIKTKKKNPSYPISLQVLCQYYGYSKNEGHEALPILSNEDIMELAEELGLEKEMITKLKKEIKVR